MLQEGINLMAVGMTTVFSFLTLLVIVLQISGRESSTRSAIAGRTRRPPPVRFRGNAKSTGERGDRGRARHDRISPTEQR